MTTDDRVTHVLVSLTDVPIQGDTDGVMMLVRLQEHNRDLITQAAKIVGMSQAKFLRTVLVSAARKVLSEAGVKPDG